VARGSWCGGPTSTTTEILHVVQYDGLGVVMVILSERGQKARRGKRDGRSFGSASRGEAAIGSAQDDGF